MKKLLLTKFNLGICIIFLLLSSCSRSIDGMQTVKAKKNNNSEIKTSGITNQKKETQFDSNLNIEKKLDEGSITASSEISVPEIKNEVIPSIRNNNTNQFEIDWSANNLEECDIIVLKSGEEVNAKVTEIGQDEIKYKKCDNLAGPTYTMNKSLVFMIKYSNGTKDIINSTENSNQTQNNSNNNAPVKVESNNGKGTGGALGIVSLSLSFIGLFIFTIVFAPIAIIFGILGLFLDKKLKGFSIAGIILGFIGIALYAIFLSLLYYY